MKRSIDIVVSSTYGIPNPPLAQVRSDEGYFEARPGVSEFNRAISDLTKIDLVVPLIWLQRRQHTARKFELYAKKIILDTYLANY